MRTSLSFFLSAATTLCIIFILHLAYRRIKFEKQLRDYGKKAEALILSIDEEYKHLVLHLRIEPLGHPPFEAKKRVDRWAHDPFHAGDRIGILVDPQNPNDFVLEYPFGEKKKR